MEKINYRELECASPRFWSGLVLLVFLILLALVAVFYMEHHGHYVTGMTNQIVWGLPMCLQSF